MVLEAQLGAMRDIDYGIFPYTSSSSTISAYGPIGAGIPGKSLDHVIGVLKAYSTCVGAGPFVAEHAMSDDWEEALRKAGGEYGAATGRPRRIGPFDAVASRYGLKCQNADQIALTKMDVLSSMKEIPVITGYKRDGVVTMDFDPMDELDSFGRGSSRGRGRERSAYGNRRKGATDRAAVDYVLGEGDEKMARLFINIGKAQRITPGDILGAVAGESGIPGRMVGSIDMYDGYTFVDVPGRYADDVLKAMAHAKIKGKNIHVEKANTNRR